MVVGFNERFLWNSEAFFITLFNNPFLSELFSGHIYIDMGASIFYIREDYHYSLTVLDHHSSEILDKLIS